MKNLHRLKIKNIQYKKNIIKDISLIVNSGEIVGLFGPNGSGKTTIFNIISGIIKQDSGKIFLDKFEISSLPIYLRCRMGIAYLSQESSIFLNISVYKNIMSALEIKKKLFKRKTVLNRILKIFKIEKLRDKLGSFLSGGEKRKVEIARLFATFPKFILLDEPFSGIDPISTQEIKQIIKKMQEKKIGMLITDHNIQEVLEICDRIYIVNYGKIIFFGNLKEVLQNKKIKQLYFGKKFIL
ncbi:LPS export ABC transporter ATP-binding protein [bacterium endosymbiont of Pedicinus badii]|uniref:LPS export ABC transporter ATP-binding protein n=1 Tax=bacterium endosymbiont of Pedicinus badii TaxID=1719126 RepID=UPI0009BA6721|nr:LPS export ABC transporter ATP-binding protein [bacterium endosymbiont of Pedicinus badii]OQM34142.1 LPS export ABC transporter ATP-binding protein [bacterium endosymbiont of Pedicinus badii]